MAASKYKCSLQKKLNSELVMVVSSLKKQDACLKKTLAELSQQHSQQNKLLEASTRNEQTLASTQTVTELHNELRDALEKNKQWLEYDQQREACMRAILARVLWLEKQLSEANQAFSQQHNEEHSDVTTEKERANQMQEHYEKLLQKAKNEQEALREQLDVANDNLIIAQNWCEEREKELEVLKQQLQTERMSRESAQEGDHCSKDEEQQLKDKTKDFQSKLNEERRRSANLELQANLFQRFMLNRHHADQENTAELQRQRDQQDHNSCEVMQPPSQLSRDFLASSPLSSSLNESFLECPSCHAEYPASHYRELINHLEICLD